MRLFRAVLMLALAILVTGSSVAAASPTITEFSTGLTSNSGPWGITAGPDGNLWFTENASSKIGRITPAGTIVEFGSLLPGSAPRGIAAGPDGNLWFAAPGGVGSIGRMTTSGVATQFTIGLTVGSQPESITAGPDGNLWFTEKANPGRIGRITPAGAISEFTVGLTVGSQPESITAGPDGNLWFTENANPGQIGRITPAGVITEFWTGLTSNSAPNEIIAGPDGNLWFTEYNNPGRLGRITTSGAVSEFSALTPNLQPGGIAAGGDGSLWFTEGAAPGQLGRVTVLGDVTEYASGLTAGSGPLRATAGPDGNVWFTETNNPGRIGRITVPPGAGTTAASSVADNIATVNASVRANSQATSYYFEYGATPAYGATTATASAGSSATATPVGTGLSGLTAGTQYHYRVVATNGSGTTTGSDQTFTTTGSAPTPPPPATGGSSTSGSSGSGPSDTTVNGGTAPADQPLATLASAPVFGGAVVLAPSTGQVLIKPKGAKRFVPLTAGTLVPVGSIVDTTRGTVKLTSARGKRGTPQTGEFSGGLFEIQQQRKGDGFTDLILRGGDFRSCGKSARRKFAVAGMARKAKAKPKRKISGSDKGGRFRTRGRYGSATVRGTEWVTADYCDGTLVTVRKGAVAVRDRAKKKTVLVTAGHSYFSRARRSAKRR